MMRSAHSSFCDGTWQFSIDSAILICICMGNDFHAHIQILRREGFVLFAFIRFNLKFPRCSQAVRAALVFVRHNFSMRYNGVSYRRIEFFFRHEFIELQI
jgi:hypothetical protein